MSRPQSALVELASTRWWREFCKNPKCRVLLVEKTDRLPPRNLKDYVTLDEIEGLEFDFVKEGTGMSPDSRSNEEFIDGIQSPDG